MASDAQLQEITPFAASGVKFNVASGLTFSLYTMLITPLFPTVIDFTAFPEMDSGIPASLFELGKEPVIEKCSNIEVFIFDARFNPSET